jgi:two-component system, chemotaxis family, protein-glutamate methylesterase/glutaminase
MTQRMAPQQTVVKHHPIRVMVVDDSALVRTVMSEILAGESDIALVGTATDPFDAVHQLRTVVPDVIILDIEMPKMNGISFLRKLMQQHPIPTVICSSQAQTGSRDFMAALDAGAVDIIPKPSVATRAFFEESRNRICDVIRAASLAKLGRKFFRAAVHPFGAETVAKMKAAPPVTSTFVPAPGVVDKVVAVGASTGGTEALLVFLQALPMNVPGIAIVQHMPAGFTATFAKRLDQLCTINIREAQDGDTLGPSMALIAPGDTHLTLKRVGGRYRAEVRRSDAVNRHRPSVDVLFRSVAECAGRQAIGILMTGMGADGARGLLEMKTAGAHTIAQDENSCVVYGMPAEAVKLGAVDSVLPLTTISGAVLRLVGAR